MKRLLMLSVLSLSSLAAATIDPCKLLSPNEVGAALGMSGVTAQPPEEADFPTCTFGGQDSGGLSLIVATPAQKLSQGKSLSAFLQHGGDDGQGMKFDVLTPLKDLGDDAVVGSSRSDSSANGVKMVIDGSTLLVRKGNTLMMLMGFSVNQGAPKLSAQSLTALAKRAAPAALRGSARSGSEHGVETGRRRAGGFCQPNHTSCEI